MFGHKEFPFRDLKGLPGLYGIDFMVKKLKKPFKNESIRVVIKRSNS